MKQLVVRLQRLCFPEDAGCITAACQDKLLEELPAGEMHQWLKAQRLVHAMRLMHAGVVQAARLVQCTSGLTNTHLCSQVRSRRHACVRRRVFAHGLNAQMS